MTLQRDVILNEYLFVFQTFKFYIFSHYVLVPATKLDFLIVRFLVMLSSLIKRIPFFQDTTLLVRAHVSYTAVGRTVISYINVRMKWGRKSHRYEHIWRLKNLHETGLI